MLRNTRRISIDLSPNLFDKFNSLTVYHGDKTRILTKLIEAYIRIASETSHKGLEETVVKEVIR